MPTGANYEKDGVTVDLGPLGTVALGIKPLKDTLVGTAETAATMGTGLAALVPAGTSAFEVSPMLSGVSMPGGIPGAVDRIHETQDAYTYQPRSKAGQEDLQQVGGWIEFMGEKLIPYREKYENFANPIIGEKAAGMLYAGTAGALAVSPLGVLRAPAAVARSAGRFGNAFARSYRAAAEPKLNTIIADVPALPRPFPDSGPTGRPINQMAIARGQRGAAGQQPPKPPVRTLNVPANFSQDTKSLVQAIERRGLNDLEHQDAIDFMSAIEDRMYDLTENIGTAAAKKEADWLLNALYHDLGTISDSYIDSYRAVGSSKGSPDDRTALGANALQRQPKGQVAETENLLAEPKAPTQIHDKKIDAWTERWEKIDATVERGSKTFKDITGFHPGEAEAVQRNGKWVLDNPEAMDNIRREAFKSGTDPQALVDKMVRIRRQFDTLWEEQGQLDDVINTHRELQGRPQENAMVPKEASVTDLTKRRQEIKQQHDEIMNEIRQKVSGELQDMETASRMEKVDPESIHKIGDRFVTDNGVRLEIKKYNRVNDDGTVHYDVEQTFPDGHKGQVTLKNENLGYAEKQGGLRSLGSLGPGKNQRGSLNSPRDIEKRVIDQKKAEFKRRSGGFNHGVEVENGPDGKLQFIDDLMNEQIREFGINQGYNPDAYLHATALFSDGIESMQLSRSSGLGGNWKKQRGSVGEQPTKNALKEQHDPDAYYPQRLEDGKGWMMPTATQEQLGYGIQGWSRPDVDPRGPMPDDLKPMGWNKADHPLNMLEQKRMANHEKLTSMPMGKMFPNQRGAAGEQPDKASTKPMMAGNYPTTTPGRIRNETKAKGGYSVNMMTGEVPTEGIIAGKWKNTDPRIRILSGPVTKKDVDAFVNANRAQLSSMANHLGTWNDSGRTFLELSQLFKEGEVRKATKFAERTEQEAIYDLSRGMELPVGNWDEFINSPEFAARMQKMEVIGAEFLSKQQTREWWDTYGTLIEEIYGTENMRAFAGYIATTSTNSNPVTNIRTMSEYMRRHLIGEDIIQPDWRIPEGTVSRNAGTQIGMEETRIPNLLKVQAGDIETLSADKVNNMARAASGDPDAGTLDRHWARIAEDPSQGVYTATTKDTVPSGKQYGQLYNPIAREAEAHGRGTANFSADVWVGIRETIKNTGELFGQKYQGSAVQGSSKGIADLFEDLLKDKAKKTGMSVKELKQRLGEGDANLLSIILSAPLAAWAYEQMLQTDDSKLDANVPTNALLNLDGQT